MRLLFQLKERLAHPNLKRGLRECMPLDGVDREKLLSTVDKKLARVLWTAVREVPYYRALAEKGRIDRENPQLEQFPVISKADIRGHEDEFISDKYKKSELERTRTSGSTGEPFMFYRGRGEWDASYAVLWRGLFRLGIRMGDKRVLVKGVDERPQVSLSVRVKRWLYGLINRCIVIDAHFLALSEENVVQAIWRIRRYRPVYLHGYVSSIDVLAATAERVGVRLSDLGVKVVVTESEKVHEFQKERISRVFGCPVAENYGCVEFGMIAQPDKLGNLCVNEDHVKVETNETGEAVFTCLDSFAFPFIRFKNGDKLTFSLEKRSPLPYQELASVDGRVAETIYLPQGGSLQGYIVMYPISKHMAHLKQYQVYQPDVEHLVIRVVPVASKLPKDVSDQIIHEMREIVGEKMLLAVENVEAIPLTKRGKRAFVVSEVRK